MSWHKEKWFKYLKNFIIGLGAAIVMLGALFKIQSWEYGGEMLTLGLCTEAFIFLLLGVLPPEKDYYWEKLYPGLDDYHAHLAPLTAGSTSKPMRPLDGEVAENALGGMLSELQSMSKSLGSLKALQEVDFTKTSEQVKSMSNFYEKINEAMSELNESLEDTKSYKEQMVALNRNLSSLNSVYGNVINAFRGGLKD